MIVAAGALTLTPAVASTGVVHYVTVGAIFQDSETLTPLTIARVGDTVRFVWVSGAHTATSGVVGMRSAALGDIDSPTISPVLRTWDYPVTRPGTFPYTCLFHPYENGVIEVPGV